LDERVGMSALCQKQTFAIHSITRVGAAKQRQGDVKAEGLGGFQIKVASGFNLDCANNHRCRINGSTTKSMAVKSSQTATIASIHQ